MKDNTRPRTFVLSAYRAKATARKNRNAHAELSFDLALEGIPFREAEGCYAGTLEMSYVVVGAHNEKAVSILARKYGQESYLAVSEHDRQAYDVNVATGYHKALGTLTHSPKVPEQGQAYTRVDGECFITAGRRGVDLPEGF